MIVAIISSISCGNDDAAARFGCFVRAELLYTNLQTDSSQSGGLQASGNVVELDYRLCGAKGLSNSNNSTSSSSSSSRSSRSINSGSGSGGYCKMEEKAEVEICLCDSVNSLYCSIGKLTAAARAAP